MQTSTPGCRLTGEPGSCKASSGTDSALKAAVAMVPCLSDALQRSVVSGSERLKWTDATDEAELGGRTGTEASQNGCRNTQTPSLSSHSY